MVFIDNKYTRWYYRIIDKALAENYTYSTSEHEKHHIVPKSIGGSNKSNNIVTLTFKQHYVCHLLLTKMCLDKEHHNSMMYAFYCMGNKFTHHNHYTSRNFAAVKVKVNEIRSHRMTGENNPFFGKKHKDSSLRFGEDNSSKRQEVRDKMSSTRKAMLAEDPTKHPSYGKSHSEERKRKIAESLRRYHEKKKFS